MRKPRARDFRSNSPATPGPRLPWREIAPDAIDGGTTRQLVNPLNSYLRDYRLGECSVTVTREFNRWHLSIAHTSRYPTWDEVAQARYNAIPRDVFMAMLLPPPGEYIDIHHFCFQMIEIDPRTF
jgi:hypothetical protein